MKILRIIHSVNPAEGGPVEGLLNSSKKLIELGHVIDVVSLDWPEDDWVKSFPYAVFALGESRRTYGYSGKCKAWLEVNVGDYDVVIIHGVWQYHTVAAAHACKSHGIPYFVFAHGMLSDWFRKNHPLKHIKKLAYWSFLLRNILRNAEGVIFTNDEERLSARRSFPFYACHEIIVSYGIADQTINLEQQKSEFLQAYPFMEGKRFFLFLGRLHPIKGVDILIEAFAEANTIDQDQYLVIAGPDETGWMKNLQVMVDNYQLRERVIFTGLLRGDLKWGAYGCADCFVLPSHHENFGISVAEALSAGLPVLISNKVNIYREVLENNAGFASNDDVHGFAGLLKQWAAINPQIKANMRNNARQCFLAHFEITRAAKSLEEVLLNAKT